MLVMKKCGSTRILLSNGLAAPTQVLKDSDPDSAIHRCHPPISSLDYLNQYNNKQSSETQSSHVT